MPVPIQPSKKAPSAKRCIKTSVPCSSARYAVQSDRKHRAPKGALRHDGQRTDQATDRDVRKHRAPKGALRLPEREVSAYRAPIGQKAPSAKRCIKTHSVRTHVTMRESSVRKHRAPKGALRLICTRHQADARKLESTKRQKVH